MRKSPKGTLGFTDPCRYSVPVRRYSDPKGLCALSFIGIQLLVSLALVACGTSDTPESAANGTLLVFDTPVPGAVVEDAVVVVAQPPPGRAQSPETRKNTGSAQNKSWDQLGGYDSQLQSQVESVVQEGIQNAKTHGKLKGKDCAVSVVVLDLKERSRLVALGSTRLKRPASNQKILTVLAALTALGPAGSFDTKVEIQGEVKGGILRGQLILRAGGDPVYDRAQENAMPEWAESIRKLLLDAGIHKVEGDLVLDTGTYAAPGPGPAWPSANEHWQEYCALSGGFSANGGCLSAVLEAAPGMLRVRVLPPGHGLKEEITVRKGPAGKALDVRVGVQGPRVIVGGTIPSGIPRWSSRFAHPDPVALFGGSLIMTLGLQGFEITGQPRVQAQAAPGTALGWVSRPIAGQLEAILQDSNNSVADQVFLTLGARAGDGSRAGSLKAVREALDSLGLNGSSLVMVDGSGLSRDNQVTTRLLAGSMGALREHDPRAFGLFLHGLPLAGSSGSLSKRMRSGPAFKAVRAKTGFIGGTSGLSGIVLEEGRARLAFSILVEYPRKAGLNTRAWKPMQDRIAQLLAAWVVK